MQASKVQSIGLRLLAAKLLKQDLSELEVEHHLAKVLDTPPVPSDWQTSEKVYASQVAVILLRKYQDKIETLVFKILELARITYVPEVDDNCTMFFLNTCCNLIPNLNMDSKVLQTALSLIQKIVMYFSREKLLLVAPKVLGRIIKSICGDYSRKEAFLKSSIKCMEDIVTKWVIVCYPDNRAIEAFREEAKKAKVQQELLMLGTDVSTKSVAIPTLDTKFKTSKQIQDYLFETFHTLSPLHNSTSFLPGLSESVLVEYAKSVFKMADSLRLLPVVSIPLTSLCIFLSPYWNNEYSHCLLPSSEDFKALLSFSKEVDSKKCLAKLRVLTLLSQEDEPKTQELFASLTIQDLLALVPFNAQVLEVVTELGNAAEDAFQDDKPLSQKIYSEINFKVLHDVISLVKDYFPSLHFRKEIIAEFFQFLGKAVRRETGLQLISHLEDFVAFADSLPTPTQTNHSRQPEKLAISVFENRLRRYSAVQEPLDDLVGNFFLLIGLVTASEVLHEDLGRLLLATMNAKRVIESYIDIAVMPATSKKLYRTVIIGESLALLSKCNTAILLRDLRPKVADLESFVTTMLTVEATCGLHANLSKNSIRLLAYQISSFSHQYGWPEPLSPEGLISKLAFNIVEKVKLTLLNFPSSHRVISMLHVMAGLAQYNNPDLVNSLLPLLQTFLVENSRPQHLLPLLIVFKRLLSLLLPAYDELQRESKKAVEEGDKTTVANMIRKIALQAFMALPASPNNLAVETLWQCGGLILETMLDVPMALEEQKSSFSANEPAHCVIENAAGALIVELWPIISKEIHSLSASFLVLEESLGAVVLEAMQSRTERKRESVKHTLIQKIKEESNIVITQEESQKLIESAIYFGRECSLLSSKPQQSKHNVLLLLPCLAFFAKVHRLNPSILSSDRVKPVLSHLAIPLICTTLQTTTQAKLLIEIARLWKLSDDDQQKSHYSTMLQLKLRAVKQLESTATTSAILKKYLAQFIAENETVV